MVTGVPPIDGYSIAPVPADDVLWPVYGFPTELTLNHGLVVGADGTQVARLIIASATGDRPAIDTFVEQTFAQEGGVQLPLDSVTVGEGTFVVSNGAAPAWTEMETNAVVRAEQEIDGNFQWAWGFGGQVWIVRGRSNAEGYVRELLRVHATSLTTYDLQGMLGDLWDHTPTVAGYQYIDFPRETTLSYLDARGFGDCAERFYLGAVLLDGQDGQSINDNDLWLGLEKAGGACVANGILDDVAGDIANGRRSEQIGGLTVYRDDQFATALVGDVLITFFTANPQTYVDMAPFINQFFAGQPR